MSNAVRLSPPPAGSREPRRAHPHPEVPKPAGQPGSRCRHETTRRCPGHRPPAAPSTRAWSAAKVSALGTRSAPMRSHAGGTPGRVGSAARRTRCSTRLRARGSGCPQPARAAQAGSRAQTASRWSRNLVSPPRTRRRRRQYAATRRLTRTRCGLVSGDANPDRKLADHRCPASTRSAQSPARRPMPRRRRREVAAARSLVAVFARRGRCSSTL